MVNLEDADKNLSYSIHILHGQLKPSRGKGRHRLRRRSRKIDDRTKRGRRRQTYTYDVASNKTGCVVTVDGTVLYDAGYEYDGMNRLSVVKITVS